MNHIVSHAQFADVRMRRPRSGCLLRRALFVALTSLALGEMTDTRVAGQTAGAQPPVMVPGFWDPRRRPERPDLSRITVIRFLTEIDYPPFNFPGPDGNPT